MPEQEYGLATCEVQLEPYLHMDRHEQVLYEVLNLKVDVMRKALMLGHLLAEITDNKYYLQYGYPTRKAWLQHGSGLDISDREAFYLANVSRRSKALGIPEGKLLTTKISKLKKIFTLTDEEANTEQVLALIEGSKDLSLKAVNETVDELKGEVNVYRTLKHDVETDTNVILPAFERIRREYGDTVDSSGDVTDITDSKVVEMLCANYLASAEELEYDIIEAEFEDVHDTQAWKDQHGYSDFATGTIVDVSA